MHYWIHNKATRKSKTSSLPYNISLYEELSLPIAAISRALKLNRNCKYGSIVLDF